MTAIKQTALVALCATLLLCAYSGPALAVQHVGFASMGVPKLEGAAEIKRAVYWQQKFRDVTRALFDIKYSSFSRVVNKLNLVGFRPKTLQIYMEESGEERMLRPHRDNEAAIEEFHQKFQAKGERYLGSVGMSNSASVVIFDEMPPIYELEGFLNDEIPMVSIQIRAYYGDSGTMGFEFLDVNKKSLMNYGKLKKDMHAVIITALEDVIGNQASLADSNNGAGGEMSSANSDW